MSQDLPEQGADFDGGAPSVYRRTDVALDFGAMVGRDPPRAEDEGTDALGLNTAAGGRLAGWREPTAADFSQAAGHSDPFQGRGPDAGLTVDLEYDVRIDAVRPQAPPVPDFDLQVHNFFRTPILPCVPCLSAQPSACSGPICCEVSS